MRTFFFRALTCCLLALSFQMPSFALERSIPLASEEAFLAALGDRAVPVAPGVYEFEAAGGDKVRVAFGDAGRRFDRERFEKELAELEAVLARTDDPSREMLRERHRLEDLIAGLQTPIVRAAVTGWTCPGTALQYPYSLDGSLSSGVVTAKASVGIGVDFSPRPSRYPNRYADSYATAYRGQFCLETTVTASDSITNGALGIASATASASCSGTCVAWETFSEVTESGCTDGYRSLYRWGGTLANCP